MAAVARDNAIPHITGSISFANHWDHFLARIGINRTGHRVKPGLYALGNATADSPVFVTANYTLSFDALRSALAEINCYIMVLDTEGINVWCAAGKGTFGTEELVQRIEKTGLHDVVNHRVIIVPQLGASGIAAHEVKKRSGFRVEYGPIRAADLPEYLMTHQATSQMRSVTFSLHDRLVLIPVELSYVLLPMFIAAVILYFTDGLLASVAIISAILTGVVLFPLVLPWIPTPNFSTKGFLLGMVVAFPFAVIKFLINPYLLLWQRIGFALTYLLLFPPVTAFLALNFTGSTNFTSKSGVKREIFAYIPIMAWVFGSGVFLTIILILLGIFRGSR